MSAPRSSMRALRYLSASSRQVRCLHMTGPATYASPVLTGDMEQSKRATLESSKTTASKGENTPAGEVRHFNTSRALKAVNDTSTIDFAYLPEIDPDMDAPQPQIRVPLLPSNFFPTSTKTAYTAEEEEIVRSPTPFSYKLIERLINS
jgi:hypothetical protein